MRREADATRGRNRVKALEPFPPSLYARVMRNPGLRVALLLSALVGCGNTEHAPPAPIEPEGETSGDAEADPSTDEIGVDGAASTALTDAGGIATTQTPWIGSFKEGTGACSYVNTLDDSGKFTIRASTGEIVKADYKVTPPSTPGRRYAFEFTVTSDNNIVDCENMMNDETGDFHAAFMEFPDSQRVLIFTTPTGGSPVFSWTRIQAGN